jgi:hypothetical protein
MMATNFAAPAPQQGAGQFRPQSLFGDIGGAVGRLFGSQQTGQTVGEAGSSDSTAGTRQPAATLSFPARYSMFSRSWA